MTLRKSTPVLEVKSLTDEGLVEGYASTFGGEPDAYGDVIAPGAFTKSIEKHRADGTRLKMYWNHNREKPIGSWDEFEEDERGLIVKGRLNMDVQQAVEARALLAAADIDGLSIGYRLKEYSVDTETNVWTLEEIDLREVSICPEGANDHATVTSVKAAKSHHDLLERMKAGDQLSERDFGLMLRGLGFSKSQADRAATVHLKAPVEPAAESAMAFVKALQPQNNQLGG